MTEDRRTIVKIAEAGDREPPNPHKYKRPWSPKSVGQNPVMRGPQEAAPPAMLLGDSDAHTANCGSGCNK